MVPLIICSVMVSLAIVYFVTIFILVREASEVLEEFQNKSWYELEEFCLKVGIFCPNTFEDNSTLKELPFGRFSAHSIGTAVGSLISNTNDQNTLLAIFKIIAEEFEITSESAQKKFIEGVVDRRGYIYTSEMKCKNDKKKKKKEFKEYLHRVQKNSCRYKIQKKCQKSN